MLANVLTFSLSYVDGSGHNNGDLMSMSATEAQTIPGRTYTYETLNRLSSMTASSDPYGWYGLQWTYDA